MTNEPEDFDRKYYNDVILYKTIEQIDRVRSSIQRKSHVLALLAHLEEFFTETLEFEKSYFVSTLKEYITVDYSKSFEETYLLKEDAAEIKLMLEKEYGGSPSK